jgi:hypothetical protein
MPSCERELSPPLEEVRATDVPVDFAPPLFAPLLLVAFLAISFS